VMIVDDWAVSFATAIEGRGWMGTTSSLLLAADMDTGQLFTTQLDPTDYMLDPTQPNPCPALLYCNRGPTSLFLHVNSLYIANAQRVCCFFRDKLTKSSAESG